MNDIITLSITSFATTYLLFAWFNSTIKVHITNLLFRPAEKLYTVDDFDAYILEKFNSFFYALFNCSICLVFYFSFLVNVMSDPTTAFFPTVFATAFLSHTLYSLLNKFKSEETTVSDVPEANTGRVGIHDVGGYILDFNGSNKGKVLGVTNVMKDYAANVFESNGICNFPGCERIKADYEKELKELQAKFEAKGVKCPDCNKASLKNKYYDIIKAIVLK